MQSLKARVKGITLALGANDALVRHAELPMVPISDMRMMLKLNPKAYLQQDLPQHVFDCVILPAKAPKADDQKRSGPQKCRVLVGGAKAQLLEDLQTAVRSAGFVPDQFVPGILGPVNAFEMAQPEIFSKEVVALADIGFKSTTISILMEGELALNRVVPIGGDKMTSGLAESMGISYAEAEGIKVGMPAEVMPNLEPLLIPLGRELRASIDFFEHQQDKTVSQVFFSGATARSEIILQTLQNELLVPCKSWNPISFLQLSLPPQQLAEVEQVSPQLAVAVGAAMSSF
jgi:Tfp pilus assembly PilM family ATPase